MTRIRTRSLLVLLCLAGAASLVAVPARAAWFLLLDGPDGHTSFSPTDISTDGSTIVGGGSTAVVWDAEGGPISLGDLPGSNFVSHGYAISGDGSIAVGYGYSTASGTGGTEAFVWDAANGMQGLGDLAGGTFSSIAFDISADGSTIVGRGTSASGTEAFRWTQATGMQALGDLAGGSFSSVAQGVSADGSRVVGYSTSAVGAEAFLWDATNGMVGLGGLPGGPGTSVARAISDDGEHVVGYSEGPSGREAFIWDPVNGMQGLGLASGCTESEAWAVSADGSVVVGHCIIDYLTVAVVWDETNGMRTLESVLTGLGVDPMGLVLRRARAISADGTRVAGSAEDVPMAIDYGFVADLGPASVPLLGPSGWLLLTSGLTVVGVARARATGAARPAARSRSRRSWAPHRGRLR